MSSQPVGRGGGPLVGSAAVNWEGDLAQHQDNTYNVTTVGRSTFSRAT